MHLAVPLSMLAALSNKAEVEIDDLSEGVSE